MIELTKVNKKLGENIKKIVCLNYKSAERRGPTMFNTNKKQFRTYLSNKGYAVSELGNYITAKNNNESNTFFFSAHNPNCSNYLVSVDLKYRVQYFAFYNNDENSIHILAYNKVREYCKSIETGVRFGAYGEEKMLIPDSWVKEQKINVIDLNNI